jgi:hypothetical protein
MHVPSALCTRMCQDRSSDKMLAMITIVAMSPPLAESTPTRAKQKSMPSGTSVIPGRIIDSFLSEYIGWFPNPVQTERKKRYPPHPRRRARNPEGETLDSKREFSYTTWGMNIFSEYFSLIVRILEMRIAGRGGLLVDRFWTSAALKPTSMKGAWICHSCFGFYNRVW